MTKPMILAALLLATAPVLSLSGFARPGFAQTSPTMPGMPKAPGPSAASPADQGLMAAMDRMNATMKVPLTGNPDADFVAMMIPHHQGAVDMAKVELQYGKNEQLRRMADRIVTAQTKQIDALRRWQARHGRKHAQ
jgi:uncharacterized protein (DUF305 family)